MEESVTDRSERMGIGNSHPFHEYAKRCERISKGGLLQAGKEISVCASVGYADGVISQT